MCKRGREKSWDTLNYYFIIIILTDYYSFILDIFRDIFLNDNAHVNKLPHSEILFKHRVYKIMA